MATQPTTNDPWESAETAKPRDFEYFGQANIDCWFAFFPGNGARPIPWDANQHPIDKRTTMTDIQIIPIAEQNVRFDVKYGFTDFSLDWTKICLPSIKDLGKGLRDLNKAWVRVVQVEGNQLRDKNDPSKGHYNTIKFVEVFQTEEECRAAFLNQRGVNASAGGSAPVQQPASQPAAAPVNGNGNGKERETAFKFLSVIVENAARGQSDLGVIQNTIAANIANMPMVAKHFTAQSPETMNLIAEAMTK